MRELPDLGAPEAAGVRVGEMLRLEDARQIAGVLSPPAIATTAPSPTLQSTTAMTIASNVDSGPDPSPRSVGRSHGRFRC